MQEMKSFGTQVKTRQAPASEQSGKAAEQAQKGLCSLLWIYQYHVPASGSHLISCVVFGQWGGLKQTYDLQYGPYACMQYVCDTNRRRERERERGGSCSKAAESKLQYLSSSLKLLIIVSVHGLECYQRECCLMLMGCILGIRQEMIT